jgi:hypothetical protein
MPLGPGKYDDLCTDIREYVGLGGSELQSGGGVILIVIGGDRGNGFSCQADLETTLLLPDLLEDMAKQIRESSEI